VAEPISKQRMCALNLVDVVDGLTSARVMVRDLMPLREKSKEEIVGASRAAVIYLNTAKANLDAASGYCELDFSNLERSLESAKKKIGVGDIVDAEEELMNALPKLKDVLRPCAQKRE